ncbi:MAG: DUF459 domain-containing protein [Actinomycetes bacterium]
MNGRDPSKLPFGRRRRTAASALVAVLVAFILGVLFNAPAMKKTALELPFGGQRSFRLALVSPAAAVSHWLFLDRPARFAAAALGKPDPGPQPVEVVVVTPHPTPRPTPHSSSSGKPQLQPTDKPLPKPYAGHPLHLYIAGDSMAGIPGMALVNLAKDTHLIKPLLDYHISSGLVRPDFFNWPAQLQQQVKAFDPGAAVVMWGANDNQGVQTSSGKVYEFGSSGWEKEYRKRIGDALAILFDGGVRRVYWVGQPIMPGSTYDRQIRLMNDIFRDEARKHPGVQYIDAYEVFSDSGGGYAQYLRGDDGNMEQVREADGEHLTYAGGMRLAKVVMAAIKGDWLGRKTTGAGAASPSPKASATATPAP